MSDLNAQNWPEARSPYDNQAAQETAEGLLSNLTLEEKAAQVIIGDISTVSPKDLADCPLGAILNGGDASPGGDRRASPEAWLQLADAFWAASTGREGAQIPVLWGTDAVHGHNNLFGAILYPHNIGLGAAADADLIARIAAATAEDVRITGQDWIFAPTLAVAQNPRWGRFYESYSSAPEVIAAFATAYVTAAQRPIGGDDDIALLATAKHFVGDGGTTDGVDQGDTVCSEAELARLHGAGYPPSIAAGVHTVMASYNSWNGEKLHGVKYLLTDVLKGRMGFDGFVVGDWNGHAQVEGCTESSAAPVLNAGVDMLMAPEHWRELRDNIVGQVQAGEISSERLDDAVRRVLTVKARTGFLSAPRPSERPLAGASAKLSSPEKRSLAEEAVQKSLVLLKSERDVLPLRPSGRYLIIGDGASQLNKQMGGWSLSWRGYDTQNDDFPQAVSIAQGVIDQCSEEGAVELCVEGETNLSNFDAAIVVFGEEPYAEWFGDRKSLDFESKSLPLIHKFRDAGVPVVGVFLSGRPLQVCDAIDACDAFIAAWLPGTEGGGVAKALFGVPAPGGGEAFVGRLPFEWPARDGGVRWPRGYGLSSRS